ncbi:MAG TPA: NUMOD4 domain-containing protein, partial [Candidatus Absconditabacterales bacterium]|nr:NUMOD4 domain-containing protein [Candidatus Absconditabacterales bacterium]
MEIERRDIEGYEGYYQVSNTGLVKSLDRIITSKLGITRRIRGRLLSTGSNKRRGLVNLCIDTNRHAVT